VCGHVGVAGDLQFKHDKVLKQLLILDSMRGEDSTGIAAVQKIEGTVRVAKQLGDPFQLFQYKPFEQAMQKQNRCIIGHNRYATSGDVSRKNAHPFEFDGLVGAHNGTLDGKYRLLDHMGFKVDSENLFHHIDQKGLDDALSVLDGAWALVWWDKNKETLNFLRNKERTLYVTLSEDGKQLFWASEYWMLSVILARNDIKHGKVELLDEDIHHSIHINDKGELGKPVLRKAPSTYVPAYQTGGYKNSAPFVNGTNVTKLPARREVTVVKKTADASGTGLENSYLKAKGVVFETLCKVTDSHGADFISCFDANNPYAEIRLYLKKEHKLWSMLGCDVKGDISAWVQHETPGKGYFKISPWSVAPVKNEADIEMLPNHHGVLISKKDWEKLYSQCAWCTVSLNAGEENRFSTAGECFCPDCGKDEEVTQYVKMQ
jgi:predicted glutamine amidotransferase